MAPLGTSSQSGLTALEKRRMSVTGGSWEGGWRWVKMVQKDSIEAKPPTFLIESS